MAKKAKTITSHEADLRRWCIEEAIRWPTIGGYGNPMGGMGGGYTPAGDADVIGRAKKILAWVKGE